MEARHLYCFATHMLAGGGMQARKRTSQLPRGARRGRTDSKATDSRDGANTACALVDAAKCHHIAFLEEAPCIAKHGSAPARRKLSSFRIAIAAHTAGKLHMDTANAPAVKCRSTRTERQFGL